MSATTKAMGTNARKCTRRELFSGGLRYGFLLLIGAISAKVTTRKLSLAGQTCTNQGICRACGKISNCGLPQALSARAATKGNGV